MAEVLRTCRVCRAKRPKAELTRWVFDATGQLVKDEVKRLSGRGIYTDSSECAEKVTKMKVKR